jgi:hypothetical protein
MKQHKLETSMSQRIASIVAVIFGVATLMAGGRVLLGADPGYIVFRPLLIFNVLMGVAYIAAGVAIWRERRQGKYAAGTVFGLNMIVLVAIVILFSKGAAVAVDSVRAMTFRTAVWLVLLIVLLWIDRPSRSWSTRPLPGATR